MWVSLIPATMGPPSIVQILRCLKTEAGWCQLAESFHLLSYLVPLPPWLLSGGINMLCIDPNSLCPLPDVHSHASSPAPHALNLSAFFFPGSWPRAKPFIILMSLCLLLLLFTSLSTGLPLQVLPIERIFSHLSLGTTSKWDCGSQQSTFSLHPQVKPTHL